MRVVINIHDHQAQRTAAEQARQDRVEEMLAAVMAAPKANGCARGNAHAAEGKPRAAASMVSRSRYLYVNNFPTNGARACRSSSPLAATDVIIRDLVLMLKRGPRLPLESMCTFRSTSMSKPAT